MRTVPGAYAGAPPSWKHGLLIVAGLVTAAWVVRSWIPPLQAPRETAAFAGNVVSVDAAGRWLRVSSSGGERDFKVDAATGFTRGAEDRPIGFEEVRVGDHVEVLAAGLRAEAVHVFDHADLTAKEGWEELGR